MRSLFALVFGLVLMAAGSLRAERTEGGRDWPQWRGPNRDGVSTETGLLTEWPAGGPRLVWKVNHVGVGYSSLAVKDGIIYTQGDLDGVEHVLALRASDGSIVWAVQPEPAARRLAERIANDLNRLDTDSSGTIDEVEALAGLGGQYSRFEVADGDPQAVAAQRADRLLARLDKDRDGAIGFLETTVPGLVQSAMLIDAPDPQADAAALAESRTKALFMSLDKDGNGQIDMAEARGTALAASFGQIDVPDPQSRQSDRVLSRSEVLGYFQKRQAERDGILTSQELRVYYERTYPGKDGILTPEELRSSVGGYRNSYGDGPRGIPTVEDGRLYVEGAMGDLSCLDARTGKTIWHVSLVTDLGGQIPGWGYSESPLVEGDMLIVTPGGKQGTMVALDKQTGKVLWRSIEVTQGAQYSSPVPATLAGVRQVVQMARDNVFGVTMRDGKLLWTYPRANNGTANVCTPVVDGDHVFASSNYGVGGGLVHITSAGSQAQTAQEVYFEKRMANHHGGIIKVGDHLYGFGNGGLICMHFLSGEVAWTARSVGKGSLTYADGMLYCLGEAHQMALAEANPKEYVEHGRFSIPNLGRASWAHPVVSGGRLYIRNLHELSAYDVGAQ